MQALGSSPAGATIGDLAGPVAVVSAALRCGDLDVAFRSDHLLRAVAVSNGQGRVGLISRTNFIHSMAGPFGYGRALMAHKPVSGLTDWQPVVIDADVNLIDACARLSDRDREHRYDDVLIAGPGDRLRRISPARMFEQLAAHMHALAVTDALSGLANRKHLLDRLEAACADVTRRPLLIFVDLDKMKHINDTYGHNAGDRLIASTARKLAAASGPGDLVARLGGDEFAILCLLPERDATADTAGALGERIRAAVAAPDDALPAEQHSRASVGVALAAPETDANTLLTEADMAMYQAKKAGGDTVRVVTGVGTQLGAGSTAAVGLAVALRAGELRLYYQPIWSMADNRIVSVEALIRWQHPTRGLLTPGQFLPAAQCDGQMHELDHWVLMRACTDLAYLIESLGNRAPEFVNVNLAVETLQSQHVTDRILAALADAGLDPARLRVELPETADLSALTSVIPELEELHRHGVAFALDDMGAGSSTLRHLSVMPISGIKIDRAFVQGMLDNRGNHAVVKLLTDLGHSLDLVTTAEGVETPEQLAALRELGVPYAQGYLLGRPEPLDQLVRRLDSTRSPWAIETGRP